MIGSRLDDEDKEKNPNDMRNAPDVVEKALFDARVVMLTGEVNDGVARRVTERLFALGAQSAAPITFVISSPGGHVESGDMIHDVIKFINAPVRMLGTGWVASAGALIYCAAQRENRFLKARVIDGCRQYPPPLARYLPNDNFGQHPHPRLQFP